MLFVEMPFLIHYSLHSGSKALSKVFTEMKTLEHVEMPQNGINFEGISALAEAFSHNPNLRVLNLNDNTFTETGAKAMAKVIAYY